jgi:flagellar hook-length control protein FliK
VGSVASEVSAVHHARAGHGLHGSAQASNQPGAGAFGVLLDGTDDTPAPAAHSVPPGPQSSPPPPAQPNSPDHPASQTREATQADPAQAPPQPGNPPPANTEAHTRDDAQADAGTRPDDGKASTSAPGPLAPPNGKMLKPITAADLAATANITAIGGTAAANPTGAGSAADDAAHQTAGTGGAANIPDSRAKSGKSDTSDSSQDAAAPNGVPGLDQLTAPPPVVAVAINVPAVAATAQGDDGAEIDQLAALGDAAKPGRWGGQVEAGATPDVSAPGGQRDGTAAGSAAAGTSATPPSPPDLPLRPGNPNPDAQPLGRMHPHATAEMNDATGPAHNSNQVAGVIADPTQPTGAPAAHILEAASAPTGDNASDGHAQSPSAAADASVSPTTPDSLAVPANAAAPAISRAPANQAAAPTSAPSGAPLVQIAGLAVQTAAHALAGKSRFDIRLDPPELGRIDVRLDIDHDGKVTSHLVVERQETLDVLRRDAPQIERSLQQAGLKTSDDALQFTLRDQSFGQQNPYPRNASVGGGMRIVVPDADLPSVDTAKSRYGGIAGLGGGIDIRV